MELTRRSATLVLLATLLASPLLGEARDDYKAGVEALDAGNHARAAELLQRAIEQAPQAKKPLIGRAYLPHFHLGMARLGLGDCRGAMVAWRESQRQGAIDKAKQEVAELGRAKKICEQRLREFDEARNQAQGKIDEATQVSSRVALFESDELLSTVWDEGQNSLEKRYEEALRPLWAAKGKLSEADASADMDVANEAARLATESIEAFEALEVLANQQLMQLEARRKDLTQRLSRAISGAERALRDTEESASSRPVIQDLRSRLSRLVRDAKSQEAADDASIESISDRIASLTKGLRRATRMPPEEIQLAAAAYLQGDYQQTFAALVDFESDDSKVTTQACLLRSAALHALERMGLPLPLRPSRFEESSEDAAGMEEVDPPSDATEPSLVEETSASTSEDEEVITALSVLFECEDLDNGIELGSTFFPPSYLELYAEFERLRAIAALDESP